ncbi:MAG: DUF512 domain-containing protein [Clostridia bacterium]
MKEAIIKSIRENSIAEELELSCGDKVLKINKEPVGDIIDYMIEISDNYIELEVEKKNGELIIFEIEKDYNEDLGLHFDPPTITPIKTCHNNCKFCFINQMPPGLRHTLYIKDDDYRMSFMSGNYITGTNLSDEDIERIIKYNLSPLYISVHQTDKNRDILMGREKSFSIMNLLEKLKDGGIYFHTQIVLVPGYNDGKVLENTLEDLHQLKPNVLSIAIVPVGLTQYRNNLPELNQIDIEVAKETINISKKYMENYEKNIVFISDEIFIKAQEDIPKAKYYQDYSQLENGIGMLRIFIDQFKEAMLNNQNAIKSANFNKKCLIITGKLTEVYIVRLLNMISKINDKFEYEVISIENKFFGDSVNVTGLLVGSDIINKLNKFSSNNIFVLLPDNTLDYDNIKFLDGITLEEIKNAFSFSIIETNINGESLIKEILKEGVS